MDLRKKLVSPRNKRLKALINALSIIIETKCLTGKKKIF